jgi:hypothetical protein
VEARRQLRGNFEGLQLDHLQHRAGIDAGGIPEVSFNMIRLWGPTAVHLNTPDDVS